MGSDHLEASARVHADRSRVGGIADHGDHLAIAARLAFGDQAAQQLYPDAAAMDGGRQIDRVLHGEAVGRPGSIGTGISIADHGSRELGDQIRKAAVAEGAEPPGHLGKIGRDKPKVAVPKRTA